MNFCRTENITQINLILTRNTFLLLSKYLSNKTPWSFACWRDSVSRLLSHLFLPKLTHLCPLLTRTSHNHVLILVSILWICLYCIVTTRIILLCGKMSLDGRCHINSAVWSQYMHGYIKYFKWHINIFKTFIMNVKAHDFGIRWV